MSRTLWARVAGVCLLAAAGTVVSAGPAQAAAPTAVFTRQSAWASGYVGTFTVTNGSAAALAWRLEFDLPAGTAVESSWSARLIRTGGHYAAVGEGWNATLASGASTTFGWVARGTGAPTGCRLNGGPCAGGGADVRPPGTPGNLRTALGPTTFTLRWDASADDVGVTGYEVYVGGSLAATVTGTEHVMPIPPPAIFTYRVRALDAAGNASPFAMITPGGPPDTVAPGAPADLRVALGAAGVTLSWTAATDNVGVAGYDVSVNGVHAGATSRTALTVPPVGFGVFTFTVVAFDGAGLDGPPVSVAIAVDPPPAG